ncbi:retrovirus-related Pol polyprotein from type-1 retrotransposable element R2 [Trichonephila inaurata madagascariensis]|uniref:Retrovirus-related Pol polyprotein from type-1 retrotransposable element R2 n=1 Tax=Trichonephila inaurata madagascariensis TaxID=2747483 RepID=A0A8X6XMY2_9ARAC|nr:retrovirus-related Pol polyprotein from type-1 retrotransposable element R2 [Trichonephila inaurata madagascariensis]
MVDSNYRTPQQVQQTYKWNRRKCVRAITQEPSQRCPVNMEETFRYFQSVWETSNSPVERIHSEPPTRPLIMESFSQPFVAGCLKSAENSAPGQDLICYKHWRELDPSCSILTRIFSICIKLSDIPKGFSPYDGVLEHNFLLTQHLEAARRCDTDKLVAWLDISNAFGSVPRQVVIDSLVACGVDQNFVSLICSIYQGSNTCVLTEEDKPLSSCSMSQAGVPASGILFNSPLTRFSHTIQENRSETILAFADDIVLLADDAEHAGNDNSHGP